MKPFTYTRPNAVPDAIAATAEPHAKFLGGGTNLIDLMKMGVEQPERLVDITRLPLSSVQEHEGGVALTVQEWHSYSAKAGWSLRLKAGKRTIVYVTPCRGALRVSFALGERAMQAARESKLPPRVIEILDEAPRYAEGAGVRLDVLTKKDLAAVKKLAAAKMAN